MSKRVISTDGEESLSKYFKDVKKTTLLTPEEEVSLAIKIQQGDELAKEKLVNSNLKFVISIAKDYQNQGLALSDLISEGNYGLVKAATRFDHTRGFRFISYAVWWIKQSIIQSLNENARLVRLPANVINKLSNLRKEIEKFEFQNEREPIYGEILDENNEPLDLQLYPRCASLNDIINDDGDEMIDVVHIKESDVDFVVDERLRKKIESVLSVLDERERHIIECYYGINTDFESMTLEAIGEKYLLTKERIRQIKEKAIRKLRHNADELHEMVRELYL
jgi:RNA polymerase primary sigma factor